MYLKLMRECTREKGYFTVQDILTEASVPRSTAQDWVSRLHREGCVHLLERPHGRSPAKYAAKGSMPASTCRRIFTAVDGDQIEIYHDCMSSACAAFCGYHHLLAKGSLCRVERDGTVLREFAKAGDGKIGDAGDIGLYPHPAVGVFGIYIEDGMLTQHIRSIGGPAYSLTDMMSRAEGVCEVTIQRSGAIVDGFIKTKILTHLIIGLDDTDSEGEGATFALAIGLLHYLDSQAGIYGIGHHVAKLYPYLPHKTAGNSCSALDVCVPQKQVPELIREIIRYVADESVSPEWGVAIKQGFIIPPSLRMYGCRTRSGIVSLDEAKEVAREHDVQIEGELGIIGALAAVSLSGLSTDILLNSDLSIQVIE
jgi:hypothetical protein